MAATGPSDKEIAEAFKSFPFATDQEYQVRDSRSYWLRWRTSDGPYLRLLVDGSTEYPGERRLQ